MRVYMLFVSVLRIWCSIVMMVMMSIIQVPMVMARMVIVHMRMAVLVGMLMIMRMRMRVSVLMTMIMIESDIELDRGDHAALDGASVQMISVQMDLCELLLKMFERHSGR